MKKNNELMDLNTTASVLPNKMKFKWWNKAKNKSQIISTIKKWFGRLFIIEFSDKQKNHVKRFLHYKSAGRAA